MEWLLDKIERALMQCFHRHVDIAMPSDQNHWHQRLHIFQRHQQTQSIGIGQAYITHHGGETLLLNRR
ncbi:Uncharacterised protein [Vibrio cholerae]|nr:Uncharacterised protein [Vibrio cholerae]